jgi:hypothetical protein
MNRLRDGASGFHRTGDGCLGEGWRIGSACGSILRLCSAFIVRLMVAMPSTRERSLPPGLSEALTLPMALAGTLRLTPEEFAEVCAANPDAVLELAADGSWMPLVPSGSETGRRSGGASHD